MSGDLESNIRPVVRVFHAQIFPSVFNCDIGDCEEIKCGGSIEHGMSSFLLKTTNESICAVVYVGIVLGVHHNWFEPPFNALSTRNYDRTQERYFIAGNY